MLVRARPTAVARGAAVLIAVTLSGAPRVLALQAPAEAHRCSCKAHLDGHHECECALCRRASLAGQARDANAPPCHRTAARQALARESRGGPRGAPCLDGHCGSADCPLTAAAGVAPFIVPSTRLLHTQGRVEPVRDPGDALQRRPAMPATPPPRAI